MTPRRRQTLLLMSVAVVLISSVSSSSTAVTPSEEVAEAKIDAFFSRFGSATAGCAIGVSRV